MNTVIWHITMSLDGFIAGRDDAMEWAFRFDSDRLADDVMRATGAILGGRGWYDAAVMKYDGVDGIYGGAWRGPVFVLTNRIADAPDDPKVTFLTEPIEAAVDIARAAAGTRNLEIFGANVARQCLDAKLIDEIVVHVAPLLLGDGVRLYGGPGMAPVELELTALAESGQVTGLRYRVARESRKESEGPRRGPSMTANGWVDQ